MELTNVFLLVIHQFVRGRQMVRKPLFRCRTHCKRLTSVAHDDVVEQTGDVVVQTNKIFDLRSATDKQGQTYPAYPVHIWSIITYLRSAE